METKEISTYINEAQQKCMMVRSRIQVNGIGRAGGKSTIIFPYKLNLRVSLMPRSTGALLAPSYQKMLQDLINPMLTGLSKFGLEEDRDFVIGKKPPKKWGWVEPYLKLKNYDYCIAWRNGAVQRVVSQDKSVTSNGIECHWIMGDEFKLLNGKRFVEQLLPAMRGMAWVWQDIPEYNSLEFFSDLYFDKRGGDWVLKLYGDKHNDEVTEAIYQLAMLVEHLEENIPTHPKLASMKTKLNIMRCNSISVIKAPSTANRYVLGANYFKTQAESMTIQEFKGSILSMEAVGGGDFYAAFDVDVHGYFAKDIMNNGLAEDLKKISDKDSTMDDDCDAYKPLDIAVDWGGTINCCSVYQERIYSVDKLNEFFTKPPEKYLALARKVAHYYRHHKNKVFYFYYDPSGNSERADSVETFAEEFANELRSNGWKVIMMSLGKKNTYHAKKHRLWSTILVERNGRCTDERFKVFRINRNNCPNSIISIANAPLKITNGSYEKDKSSERKTSGVLPEHATHFSDTDDIYMVEKQMHILDDDSSPFGRVI